MNISKLHKGMMVKNYKELCEVLNLLPTSGNSKKAQLKEIKRYCKYHKEGQKIIIDEIYIKPKEKKDNSRNSGKLKIYENLDIKESQYNNKGIYKIQLDNILYVGSTKKSFRIRFQQHNGGQDKAMIHTYNLLNRGAKFKILHDMTDIEDEELIRMVEYEFIQYFRNKSEYIVINKDTHPLSYNNYYRITFKSIKIPIKDYEKVVELLSINNISIL